MKIEIVMVAMSIMIASFIFANFAFADPLKPPPLNPLPQGEGRLENAPDNPPLLTGGDTELIPSPLTGEGQGGGELRYIIIYSLVENFVWQEMLAGEKVLEEDGLIYGVGFTAKLVYPSLETLNAGWELFLGKINYDGSIQTGERAVTNTHYLGMRFEADKGFYKGLGKNVFIEPYFGGGYRWWIRNIKDGQTSAGTPAVGYTEQWQTLYLRTGIRGEINRGNRLKPFGSIGLSIPVFTTNSVYLSEVDSTLPDVTLNPRGQISFNAEAGIAKGRLQMVLFYEQMRFAKSAEVSWVFQPESKANIVGIRVGGEL